MADGMATLINRTGMQFVNIPAGEFLMGSPMENRFFRWIQKHTRDNERPQHKVRITRPFHLGIYPVTQEQYEAVMGTNPSWFSTTGKGAEHIKDKDTLSYPVESVSWDDAVEFCRRLSELPEEKQAGRLYRLPTEAEWEYACRAGSTTRYYFGDDQSLLSEYAWFDDNSHRRTHPVGEKKPNSWGLYDMHGNNFEWCSDWYDMDYYANSPTEDPAGPATGSGRVCGAVAGTTTCVVLPVGAPLRDPAVGPLQLPGLSRCPRSSVWQVDVTVDEQLLELAERMLEA